MRRREPHGGAGADPADGREELRAGVREALAAGWRILGGGGRAVDAVEAAVCALEDHPRFNAGRGAVLTATGTIELDASIMEGDRLRCGAVGAVRGIANAITLARRVMDDGRHVLIVGDGALQFARAAGMPECDPASLVTERQRRRWLDRERTAGAAGTASAAGTVGAVARPPRHDGGGPADRRHLRQA